MLGCPYVDMDELVASFVAIYAGEALAFQSEDLTALGARGDLYLGFAVDGGYFGLQAENSVSEGEVELEGDVQSVAVEFGMLFFFDEDDQVAGRAAAFAGVASAAYAELHAFLNACGDVDGDGLFAVDPAFAFADGAFGGDDGAFAVTGGTGGNGLHLAEKGVADAADLAAAAAGGAGLNAVFIFGSATGAGIAGDVFFNFYVL